MSKLNGRETFYHTTTYIIVSNNFGKEMQKRASSTQEPWQFVKVELNNTGLQVQGSPDTTQESLGNTRE
jgi:hypothetical protein